MLCNPKIKNVPLEKVSAYLLDFNILQALNNNMEATYAHT